MPAMEWPTSTTSVRSSATSRSTTASTKSASPTVARSAARSPRPGRSTTWTGPSSRGTRGDQHSPEMPPPWTRTNVTAATSPTRGRSVARGEAGDRGVGDRVQLDDGGVDVVHHARQGEHVEHALALLDEVDELSPVAHQDGLVALDHQVGGGDVLAEVVAEVGEDLAHRLELDAGVEQGLDDLELEQVPVGVPAAAAAALGVHQRRPDQVGAGPVVELAIGDADDLCGSGAAVAL